MIEQIEKFLEYEAYVPLSVYLFLWVVIFILWTTIWSLYSLVSYRIKNKKKWIIWWRSECIHCSHKLSAKDLIPIVSYLSLWGKCRYCHKKIWSHYLFYEMITWTVLLVIYIIVCLTTDLVLNFSINNWVHWLRPIVTDNEFNKKIEDKTLFQWSFSWSNSLDTKNIWEPVMNPPAPMQEKQVLWEDEKNS